MVDIDIASPARHCAASGRELRPGERVRSVLTDEAGTFVRRDYAVDAVPERGEAVVATWVHTLAETGKPRRPVYNDDLLHDLFRHLAETADPERLSFRYVVALLLMRRKRLKFEDVKREDGQDVLILRDAKAGTRHEVYDPHLADDAITRVQDEVFHALGWEN